MRRTLLVLAVLALVAGAFAAGLAMRETRTVTRTRTTPVVPSSCSEAFNAAEDIMDKILNSGADVLSGADPGQAAGEIAADLSSYRLDREACLKP